MWDLRDKFSKRKITTSTSERGFVRRLTSMSRYDPKFTVETMEHPSSVMMWGGFSGHMGMGGLYFLPANHTMKGITNIDELENHLLPFWQLHNCVFFMHGSAPCHTSKIVKKYLSALVANINVLELSVNSADLNPIENAWHIMKKQVQEARLSNIVELKEALENYGLR